MSGSEASPGSASPHHQNQTTGLPLSCLRGGPPHPRYRELAQGWNIEGGHARGQITGLCRVLVLGTLKLGVPANTTSGMWPMVS